MTALRELLAAATPDRQALEARLVALPPSERWSALAALSGRELGRLFEVAQGAPALSLDDLARSDEPVIFEGLNSLPLFRRFQKRFRRASTGEVWGYNHQSMSWITGPGYFQAVACPDRPGELLFDYTRRPSSAQPGWPPVRGNDSGLARLVYGNLHDFMRRVAPGVLIGSAFKLGVPQNQFFVLCGQGASSA